MESKCGRSRRLAVSEEVMGMVRASDEETAGRFGPARPSLFADGSGGPVSADWLSRVFKRIWRAAGLPESRNGKNPTSCLFRRHFAYANVERWAAEGKDVSAMLPYLSRCMGHSKAECTLYYVRTSPDFLAGCAGAGVAARAGLWLRGGRHPWVPRANSPLPATCPGVSHVRGHRQGYQGRIAEGRRSTR